MVICRVALCHTVRLMHSEIAIENLFLSRQKVQQQKLSCSKMLHVLSSYDVTMYLC